MVTMLSQLLLDFKSKIQHKKVHLLPSRAYQSLLTKAEIFLAEWVVEKIQSYLYCQDEKTLKKAVREYFEEFYARTAFTDLDYTARTDSDLTRFNQDVYHLFIESSDPFERIRVLMPKLSHLLVFSLHASQIIFIKLPMNEKAKLFKTLDFKALLTGSIIKPNLNFNFLFLIDTLRYTLKEEALLHSDPFEVAQKIKMIKKDFPQIYTQLLQYSPQLKQVISAAELLLESKIILKDKLLEVQDHCLKGGSKVTGEDWASENVNVAVFDFLNFCEKTLSNHSAYYFLQPLLSHFKNRDCVETAAKMINQILENSSYDLLLNQICVIPETAKDDAQFLLEQFIRSPLEKGAARYHRLPEPILKKIFDHFPEEILQENIGNLGEFFASMPTDFYRHILIFLPEKSIKKISHNLQNFFAFLDLAQRKEFIKKIVSILDWKSSYIFALKDLNSTLEEGKIYFNLASDFFNQLKYEMKQEDGSFKVGIIDLESIKNINIELPLTNEKLEKLKPYIIDALLKNIDLNKYAFYKKYESFFINTPLDILNYIFKLLEFSKKEKMEFFIDVLGLKWIFFNVKDLLYLPDLFNDMGLNKQDRLKIFYLYFSKIEFEFFDIKNPWDLVDVFRSFSVEFKPFLKGLILPIERVVPFIETWLMKNVNTLVKFQNFCYAINADVKEKNDIINVCLKGKWLRNAIQNMKEFIELTNFLEMDSLQAKNFFLSNFDFKFKKTFKNMEEMFCFFKFLSVHSDEGVFFTEKFFKEYGISLIKKNSDLLIFFFLLKSNKNQKIAFIEKHPEFIKNICMEVDNTLRFFLNLKQLMLILSLNEEEKYPFFCKNVSSALYLPKFIDQIELEQLIALLAVPPNQVQAFSQRFKIYPAANFFQTNHEIREQHDLEDPYFDALFEKFHIRPEESNQIQRISQGFF